ncbi:cytochrome P450 [Mesorhizobium sp. URHB0026]
MRVKSFADRVMTSVGGWLAAHTELMFRIARNTVPILLVNYKGKRFALVTRFDDVAEVLARPNVFDVIYAPKIRVIMDGDNIFLGMSDVEQATRDKTTMRMTAPRAEAISRVKPEVTALSEGVMAKAIPNGRVDLAMELTQDVTTRFFGNYFGTPGPDVKTLSNQARLLFQYMFADMGDDPVLDARVRPAAATLRGYIESAIAERKQARGSHDDILERCLQFQDLGLPGMDDRGIRNNLIGLIVGAMPQAPMLIPQLFDVLLDRPEELAAAQAAARADDDAAVARYVFEASRYYPLTPGLFRKTTEDYRLAGGTWRSRTIPAGTQVLAATRSAMFDGRRVPDPLSFRLDRPDYSYMHFGAGMHECFGLYMNRVMVPAICKAVLKRPGLRRAAGDAGRLKLDSIFPMSLVVEFDT